MPIRRPIAAVLLALSLAATASGAGSGELERVMTMHADGIVVVGLDGSVASLDVTTKLVPELKPALEGRLRAMHFKPVLVDGKPVLARSSFTVYLSGEKVDDSLRVTIDGITFGRSKSDATTVAGVTEPRGRTMNPPRYPVEMQRSRVMADMQLAILITPDGRTEDVSVVRTTLVASALKGKAATHAMRQFEAVSLDTVRRWTYTVPEGFGARPPALRTVKTSILYTLEIPGVDFFAPGQWVEVTREKYRPIQWIPPEQARLAADLVGPGGGLASLGAGLQLTQPLGGTPVM